MLILNAQLGAGPSILTDAAHLDAARVDGHSAPCETDNRCVLAAISVSARDQCGPAWPAGMRPMKQNNSVEDLSLGKLLESPSVLNLTACFCGIRAPRNTHSVP